MLVLQWLSTLTDQKSKTNKNKHPVNYQNTKHFITVRFKLVQKAVLGKSTFNIMLHFIVFWSFMLLVSLPHYAISHCNMICGLHSFQSWFGFKLFLRSQLHGFFFQHPCSRHCHRLHTLFPPLKTDISLAICVKVTEVERGDSFFPPLIPH